MPLPTRLADFVASIAVLGALGGCAGAGHGNYTQKSLDEAQLRYKKLKAATDYDLAHQQYQSGNLDLALENVDRSIKNYDRVPTAHILRARILIEKGMSAPALASLDDAGRIDSEDPEIDYYKGVVFERIGELDSALGRYQAALAREIGNPKYGLATAELMIELGKHAEARFLLESARGDSASHAGYQQALGHLCLIEKKPEEAERHFAQAVALDPSDPSLIEDLARVQARAGNFAAAEANLAKALSMPPFDERRDLKFLRATCLVELRRPVEARSILLDLCRDETQAADVETWVKLVEVGAMLEDESTLRLASQRLVAMAPERAEGYLALAIAQRRAGDLKGALASTQRALAKKPDDKTALGLKMLIERQIAKG